MKWKLHNDPLQYWERSNRKTRNLLMKLLCIISEVRFCIKKLLCKQKYGVRACMINEFCGAKLRKSGPCFWFYSFIESRLRATDPTHWPQWTVTMEQKRWSRDADGKINTLPTTCLCPVATHHCN